MMFVQVAASDYSEAATPITIATVGPGTYSISATDLPDAAGMDLSITYNKAFLKDPVVTAGALTSSAMMVSNIATPGSIRIAYYNRRFNQRERCTGTDLIYQNSRSCSTTDTRYT